jgi:hypothetical protein
MRMMKRKGSKKRICASRLEGGEVGGGRSVDLSQPLVAVLEEDPRLEEADEEGPR